MKMRDNLDESVT